VVIDPVTKVPSLLHQRPGSDVMIWDRNGTALYAPKGVLEPIDAYMAKRWCYRRFFYSEAISKNDPITAKPMACP